MIIAENDDTLGNQPGSPLDSLRCYIVPDSEPESDSPGSHSPGSNSNDYGQSNSVLGGTIPESADLGLVVDLTGDSDLEQDIDIIGDADFDQDIDIIGDSESDVSAKEDHGIAPKLDFCGAKATGAASSRRAGGESQCQISQPRVAFGVSEIQVYLCRV